MALERLTQITNSGITSGITITGVNLTGIITATSANVGSGITLSETQINVGSATTIHSSGFQIGSSDLHSTGISLNNINASGIVTATTFNGNLTGNVTGNATGLSGTPSITVATINASNATFSGNVSVAGTVTYEDVTNVDSVGVITARSGIRVDSGGLVVTSGVSTFTNLVVSAGSTSAPSISPTGDSNTGIFFPSPDTIAFAEGGVEVLRIDSNGNLGIGTNNPTNELEVLGTGTVASFRGRGGSSFIGIRDEDDGTIAFIGVDGGSLKFQTSGSSYSDKLNIDASGNVGINSTSPARKLDVVDSGASGSVIRSRVTTNNGGFLAYEALNSSGTSVFSVTHNGRINLSENIVFASGQGLDFSATANSSGTMTSELLSDYEVGTWTPTFYLDGVLQNYDADRQSCFYTKIGNLVYVQFWTGWGAYGRTAFPSSSSAVFEIGGLPFVSADAFYGGSMGNARTQGGTSDNLGLSILYQTDKISFTSNSGNFGAWYGLARRSASSISGSANVVIAGAITYVA